MISHLCLHVFNRSVQRDQIEVEADVQLFVQLVELLDDLDAAYANRAVFAVVQHAVVEASLDVIDDLLHGEVDVVLQPLLDRAKVNRILDDFKVVRNAQPIRIDWVVEELRRRHSPQLSDETLGSLVPGVVHRHEWIL